MRHRAVRLPTDTCAPLLFLVLPTATPGALEGASRPRCSTSPLPPHCTVLGLRRTDSSGRTGLQYTLPREHTVHTPRLPLHHGRSRRSRSVSSRILLRRFSPSARRMGSDSAPAGANRMEASSIARTSRGQVVVRASLGWSNSCSERHGNSVPGPGSIQNPSRTNTIACVTPPQPGPWRTSLGSLQRRPANVTARRIGEADSGVDHANWHRRVSQQNCRPLWSSIHRNDPLGGWCVEATRFDEVDPGDAAHRRTRGRASHMSDGGVNTRENDETPRFAGA